MQQKLLPTILCLAEKCVEEMRKSSDVFPKAEDKEVVNKLKEFLTTPRTREEIVKEFKRISQLLCSETLKTLSQQFVFRVTSFENQYDNKILISTRRSSTNGLFTLPADLLSLIFKGWSRLWTKQFLLVCKDFYLFMHRIYKSFPLNKSIPSTPSIKELKSPMYRDSLQNENAPPKKTGYLDVYLPGFECPFFDWIICRDKENHNNLLLFDIQTEKLILTLTHFGPILNVYNNVSCDKLIVTDKKQMMYVWDIPSGDLIERKNFTDKTTVASSIRKYSMGWSAPRTSTGTGENQNSYIKITVVEHNEPDKIWECGEKKGLNIFNNDLFLTSTGSLFEYYQAMPDKNRYQYFLDEWKIQTCEPLFKRIHTSLLTLGSDNFITNSFLITSDHCYLIFNRVVQQGTPDVVLYDLKSDKIISSVKCREIDEKRRGPLTRARLSFLSNGHILFVVEKLMQNYVSGIRWLSKPMIYLICFPELLKPCQKELPFTDWSKEIASIENSWLPIHSPLPNNRGSDQNPLVTSSIPSTSSSITTPPSQKDSSPQQIKTETPRIRQSKYLQSKKAWDSTFKFNWFSSSKTTSSLKTASLDTTGPTTNLPTIQGPTSTPSTSSTSDDYRYVPTTSRINTSSIVTTDTTPIPAVFHQPTRPVPPQQTITPQRTSASTRIVPTTTAPQNQ